MPYVTQSLPVVQFRQKYVYAITKIWRQIKGDDWPDTPFTKEDIDNLPLYIKNELTYIHKLDLYSKIDSFGYLDYTKRII